MSKKSVLACVIIKWEYGKSIIITLTGILHTRSKLQTRCVYHVYQDLSYIVVDRESNSTSVLTADSLKHFE